MVLWGFINFRDKDIIYNLKYNVKFQLIFKPFVSFIILFLNVKFQLIFKPFVSFIILFIKTVDRKMKS